MLINILLHMLDRFQNSTRYMIPAALPRNLNYWDSVSTLAGEVRNPGRTFPRALVIAVVLVVAMYLLPTMAALGVSSSADPAAGWGMGYYCQVAEQVSAGIAICTFVGAGIVNHLWVVDSVHGDGLLLSRASRTD
jgi:hypothetical protein